MRILNIALFFIFSTSLVIGQQEDAEHIQTNVTGYLKFLGFQTNPWSPAEIDKTYSLYARFEFAPSFHSSASLTIKKINNDIVFEYTSKSETSVYRGILDEQSIKGLMALPKRYAKERNSFFSQQDVLDGMLWTADIYEKESGRVTLVFLNAPPDSPVTDFSAALLQLAKGFDDYPEVSGYLKDIQSYIQINH